jgi:hypothetical protein
MLLETTTAASSRAAEGQKIFSPIAAFLDEHRSQTGLAPHQQNALKALSDDLANLAQQHFNAYISGVPFTLTAPAPAPAPASLPPTPPPSRPPSGLAQSTYASVSKITPAKVASTPKTSTRPKTPAPSQRPDTRLFVRLPPTHIAKNMDAYAIYTRLRSHLGPDSKALKGVQSIKTGFALLPASPEALPALEAQKETISTFFNNCQIERSSRWISYRVTNIPRKVGQLDGSQYSLVPVNPEILLAEVAETTGFTPATVSETTASASNANTISSSWFVNFPEESKAKLPVRLSLFGMITNAQPMTRKVKTMQCNRCWKWHNPRSCARNPRCRLCGSTQHTEEGHTNHCTAVGPHTCPPRCLHCHGPHPADYDQCLLRPSKPGSCFTKAQQAEIRKTCSLTLSKARVESKCCTQPPTAPETTETPQDQDMTIDSQQTISPFRPITPPQHRIIDSPPVTTRAVRFATPQPQNYFDALTNNNL